MRRAQVLIIIQTIAALAIVEVAVLFGAFEFLRSFGAQDLYAARPVTATRLILTFLIATAVLFVLTRTLRKRIVFEAIFGLSILVGLWAFLELFIPRYAPYLAIAAIAARYIWPLVGLQNLLMIGGVAGIGIVLGTAIAWPSMLAVLMFLSLYDIFAVYGTHHMITMFKGLLDKGVIFALIIPENPKQMFKRLSDVRPGEGFFFLGSGDLALPAIFAASAAREGLAFGVGAAVGSLVGLFFTDLLFSWGRKRPMPALPPIALGTIVGFFVVHLVI